MEHFILDRRKQAFILASVASAAFVSTLDGNIVAITLPSIAEQLDAELAETSRIILVYLLFLTGCLPPIGKLATVFGSKPVFQVGFALFCLGSLLCGLAPNLDLLIFSRVIQAIGGSALLAMGYAIIGDYLPPDHRGGAMGILGAVVSVSSIVGAPIGGLLTQAFGWHSVFLVNVPIGLVAILLAQRTIPAMPRQRKTTSEPFDWRGSVLILLALMGTLYGLSEAPEKGWNHVVIWVSLGLGAVFTVLFILNESKVPSPIIPGALFAERRFTWANLSVALICAIMGGTTIVTPLYFEVVHQLEPAQSGMLFGISGVVMMLTAPIAGSLSDRIGAPGLCAVSAFLFAVVLGLLGMVTAQTPLAVLGCLFGGVGFSMGMFIAPNSSYAINSVPGELRSIASSTYNVVKNIGVLVGIAVFSAASTMIIQHREAAGAPTAAGTEQSFALAMWVSCGLSLAAAACAGMTIPRKKLSSSS